MSEQKETELNLNIAFSVLKKGRNIIVTSSLISGILFFVYSLSLDDLYKSEALLYSQNENQGASSIEAMSGLASLAGINLNNLSEDKKLLGMELISSREFFKHLITFDNILASLSAAERYDKDSQTLIFNNKIYDSVKKEWLNKENISQKPSYLEAYKIYRNVMKISSDPRTGFVEVSVLHMSPKFSKDFLDLIIQEVNLSIQKQDLIESENALKYLRDELSKSRLVAVKSSLDKLIQAQLRTQMMAKISKEYVFKVLEPPYIPEEKSEPSRLALTFIGLFLGFLFSTLFIFYTTIFKKQK